MEKKVITKAAQEYAAAHMAHYAMRNSREASELYRGIIAAYPESPEAAYSQQQIQNIMADFVPRNEVFDAQVNMGEANLI